MFGTQFLVLFRSLVKNYLNTGNSLWKIQHSNKVASNFVFSVAQKAKSCDILTHKNDEHKVNYREIVTIRLNISGD